MDDPFGNESEIQPPMVGLVDVVLGVTLVFMLASSMVIAHLRGELALAASEAQAAEEPEGGDAIFVPFHLHKECRFDLVACGADLAARKAALLALRSRLEDLEAERERLRGELSVSHSALRECQQSATFCDLKALTRCQGELTECNTTAEKKNGNAGIQFENTRHEALFARGKSTLTPHFKAQLRMAVPRICKALKDDFNRVEVVGHTDNETIPYGQRIHSGRDNWELGARRAAAVVRFLAQRGVPPEALRVASRGSVSPRTSNATKAGRRTNRRIELLYKLKPKAPNVRCP